jgi:hypothetical protein
MTLKRTPFKRKIPAAYARAERVAPVYARLTVPVNKAVITDIVLAQPKENVITSRAYQAVVRKLACIRCGVIGFTQFCHSDEGKGMGIKTDDLRGWPGCGPHPEGGKIVNGCHWEVGTGGTYTRDERRALEAQYAAKTRSAIRQSGQWPKGLAHLEIQNELELAL